MARERIVTGKPVTAEEESFTWSLRPKTLKEYIGQKTIVKKLSISLEASRIREDPQEHLLLHGPPGLGKTTLAYIIAKEMNSRLINTSGPALSRIADLMGILTNLENGTSFANAQFDTIRLKLLKIGAEVRELKTKLYFILPASCPVKHIFARMVRNIALLT